MELSPTHFLWSGSNYRWHLERGLTRTLAGAPRGPTPVDTQSHGACPVQTRLLRRCYPALIRCHPQRRQSSRWTPVVRKQKVVKTKLLSIIKGPILCRNHFTSVLSEHERNGSKKLDMLHLFFTQSKTNLDSVLISWPTGDCRGDIWHLPIMTYGQHNDWKWHGLVGQYGCVDDHVTLLSENTQSTI